MGSNLVKVLVTGGAGFIGSHLVEALVRRGEDVLVFDNLSSGDKDNLPMSERNEQLSVIEGDLLNSSLVEAAVADIEVVFHLAANSEVRIGASDTFIDLQQNVLATHNLLEAARKSRRVKKIVFTSTSTVYGEATVIPTPEDYGPLMPISLYGASKLACEALISAYCHTFGQNATIFRLANVVGPGSARGVVYDFVRKLSEDPCSLTVLGDGSQRKSYVYVSDCVYALLLGLNKSKGLEIFNVGSPDAIEVREIADIVIEEMGIRNVRKKFHNEFDGRGWSGDVKTMQLSIDRLKSLGWSPRFNSRESVRLVAHQLIKDSLRRTEAKALTSGNNDRQDVREDWP